MMSMLLFGDSSADTVQVPTASFGTTRTTSPCYSGVRFGSSGTLYRFKNDGTVQPVGAWLLKGSAANYFLFRTVDSGTLTVDAGTGLQMNANRDYNVQDTTPTNALEATVTYSISTSTTGTPVVASGTYMFEANYEPLL